jgi:hypothetical protein
MRRRRQIAASLGLEGDEAPILFSAQTGDGKGETWKAIQQVLLRKEEQA